MVASGAKFSRPLGMGGIWNYLYWEWHVILKNEKCLSCSNIAPNSSQAGLIYNYFVFRQHLWWSRIVSSHFRQTKWGTLPQGRRWYVFGLGLVPNAVTRWHQIFFSDLLNMSQFSDARYKIIQLLRYQKILSTIIDKNYPFKKSCVITKCSKQDLNSNTLFFRRRLWWSRTVSSHFRRTKWRTLPRGRRWYVFGLGFWHQGDHGWSDNLFFRKSTSGIGPHTFFLTFI